MNKVRNKYIVSWCPVCDQGWVEIVKEIESGDLFCCCDECMCEWNHPTHITTQAAVACAVRSAWGVGCDATDEDIAANGWQKFIIHEYQGHRID